MNKVECNPHNFRDWAGVQTLLRTAFADRAHKVDPPASFTRVSQTELATKAQSEDLFVIRSPLRACLFAQRRQDSYYLGKWAVAPAEQGKGLSRSLLDAAITRAKQLGLQNLTLETRIELLDNHRAFRALGFRLVRAGRHSGYTRPTNFLFQREINS